jgi:hypothetical protein
MYQTTRLRILPAAIAAVLTFGVLARAADVDYKGKIKSASASRIVIATVADAGVTIRIGDQTEITISGKPAGSGDLKAGDFVRVSAAESDGGILMATRIAVSR